MVGRVFLLWGIGILLPWNAVLTMFDFFGNEMKDPVHNYNPSFVYPFGVNGLNSMFQIVVVIWGYKLSEKFKIQYVFIGLAIIILMLPLLGHFLGSPTIKFYVCFAVLFVFGALNGMV